MVFILFPEQEKEEGGEFHPLQRFCSDLAAERELGYEHFPMNVSFHLCGIIFWFR